MKRDILICVFILVFLGNSAFGFGFGLASPPEGEDQSVVIGTSFFISTDITIPGNLDIQYSNILKNSGRLFFTNTFQSQVFLPSGDLGAGEFVFAGSDNCTLNIPEAQARVGSLKMDMAGGMVDLNGELAIPGKLELNSGIINVNLNSKLLIDNDSPDAVSFIDSPINKGYIRGFLTRNIAEGKRYLFPVGDATSFHPFLIDQPAINEVVSISFDAAVPGEIRDYLSSPAEIESSFGWRVKSDLAGQNTFLSGLSISNTPFETNASQLGIYYFSDTDLTGSSGTSLIDASYVIGTDHRSTGLYAFSSLIGLDLVNFIYVGGDNRTIFEIPDQSKYSNIRLSVYNHLGSMIFKSDHYSAEFDARNFPNGTYFYELILEDNDKLNTLRNFIDIQHEK